MPGSPFAVKPTEVVALAMDPKGEYLYASSGTSSAGAVGAFTISQTDGALTPVPGSPFVVPVGACNPSADFCQETLTDLAIEPTGKYLYAVLGIKSAMAGFTIDRTTGALSNLPGSPYPEQSGICVPQTVDVDPSGTFTYSLGITKSGCMPGSNAVLGFSINQGSGQMISIPGSPFANTNVHTGMTSEEKVLVTR